MSPIDTLINVIVTLWLYDIEVMSQGWMYWWVLVPALFYLVFMLLKWAVIFIPVWVPLAIIVTVLRRDDDDDLDVWIRNQAEIARRQQEQENKERNHERKV